MGNTSPPPSNLRISQYLTTFGGTQIQFFCILLHLFSHWTQELKTLLIDFVHTSLIFILINRRLWSCRYHWWQPNLRWNGQKSARTLSSESNILNWCKIKKLKAGIFMVIIMDMVNVADHERTHRRLHWCYVFWKPLHCEYKFSLHLCHLWFWPDNSKQHWPGWMHMLKNTRRTTPWYIQWIRKRIRGWKRSLFLNVVCLFVCLFVCLD